MAAGIQVQTRQVFGMEIKADKLSFSYPGKAVLKDISFSIRQGDFVGITGSTGSGKTTLAYCFNGLIPHAVRGRFRGNLQIDGMDTRKRKISEMARKVGLVFQDPEWQLFSLSVRDEVAFGLKNLHMKNIEKRTKDALKMVGLEGYGETLPYNLSHGQKQLLCIASVLAMEPDVIVLDEPTSQLDYRSTVHIYGILKRLNREGKTIIVIEHDTDLIAEYADGVMVLDDGKLVRNGRPREVLSDCRLMKRLGIKIPQVCR
jgi:energy-coupling factor transporter ATP-binding protein EcfA2